MFLTQTFIYTLTPKFDILISGGGSYARQEYTNFFTNAYSHKDRIGFDNLWLGFIYTGDSIADLIPQITFQTTVVQREKAINQTKNFYLKSQSLQASLRGYSDPVVYSIYVGGDLSIILSPKITLDLGAEQRFQMKQKINGYQNSEVRSIPTLSLGSTYSINSDTAVSVNASFGGSSASPDSIFGISLWKKF